MSKIESLEVTRSDFARSRRMTAKRTVAELRPVRASQVMARKRMARRIRITGPAVLRGIWCHVSRDLPYVFTPGIPDRYRAHFPAGRIGKWLLQAYDPTNYY